MRKLWLSKEDFELFHHEIGPYDYEFFRTHLDTFKRMWREQRSRFWNVFILTFEDFMWTHGALKEFPSCISGEDVRYLVTKIFDYVREQFVKGKASSAKNFILNAALVAQNKHALGLLDKVNTSQNPFYVKETREAFRSFFGEPSAKDTYVKLVLGLPLYLKFAGAIIIALKRWLSADDIDEDNEVEMDKYFVTIHTAPLRLPAIGDRTLVLRDDDPIIPADKEKTSIGSSSKSKEPNKKVHRADKSPVLPSREIKRNLKTDSDKSPVLPSREIKRNLKTDSDKSPVLPSREIKRNFKTDSDTSPTPPVSKDPPVTTPSDQEQKKAVKLHTCATCQKKEETVKTFKRCQRCRGKPNPHYYCSKECQASDWKGGHKEYHIREDTPKAVE